MEEYMNMIGDDCWDIIMDYKEQMEDIDRLNYYNNVANIQEGGDYISIFQYRRVLTYPSNCKKRRKRFQIQQNIKESCRRKMEQLLLSRIKRDRIKY